MVSARYRMAENAFCSTSFLSAMGRSSRPGVSMTKIRWYLSSNVPMLMPFVVKGYEAIIGCEVVRRLSSDDFPTLGYPAMTTL